MSNPEDTDPTLLAMAKRIVESGDLDGFPLAILPFLARGGDATARREAALITEALQRRADSDAAPAAYRELFYRTLAQAAQGPEADILQRRAMESCEEAAGGDPLRLAALLSDHARLHETRDALAEAAELRTRAVSLLDGGPPRPLARELVALASLWGCQRRYEEALDLVERACDLYHSAPEDKDRELLIALDRRVAFLERLNRWEEEVVVREEAVQLEHDGAGPRGFLAGSLDRLAAARERLGDYEGALDTWRDAQHAHKEFGTEWWGEASPSPAEARRERFARSLGASRCLAVLGRTRKALREQWAGFCGGTWAPVPHLASLFLWAQAAGIPSAILLAADRSLLRSLPWPHEELGWRALAFLADRRGQARLAQRADAELQRLYQQDERGWQADLLPGRTVAVPTTE